MRRFISTGSVLLGVLFGVSAISAQTPPTAQTANADLERRFDASINPAEMGGWMKTMAAEPNHAFQSDTDGSADPRR